MLASTFVGSKIHIVVQVQLEIGRHAGQAILLRAGLKQIEIVMEPNSWRGVPVERIAAWREAFRGADSLNVTAPCPVCGSRSLRQYYMLDMVAPREMRGVKFYGPGSYWAWCADCGAYEHATSFVPESWKGPVLPVRHELLTPVPEEIEAMVRQLPETKSYMEVGG